MLNTTIILLFFVAMMRSILLSLNQYHVYEKVSNFHLVLKGARPYPNYWFVVALDLVSVVLFSVVVFAIFRYRYIVSDRIRYFNFLPYFLLSGGIYLVFGMLLNHWLLRFREWKQIAVWFLLLIFAGSILLVCVVLSAAVLQMGDLSQGLALMGVLNGQAWIFSGMLWGMFVLVLLALSTFLRGIPVAGDFLMVLAREGIILLAYQQFSRLLMRPISFMPSTLLEVCLCNLRPYYLGLSILCVFLFLLITMMSDRKENDDRKMPPPLVKEQDHRPHPILTSNAETAVLQGQKVTIIVHKQPFELEVRQADQLMLKLNAGCFSQRMMISREFFIPKFFPENRFQFFWQEKKKKSFEARQLHVSENRLQIDFEQDLQMMVFLLREDIIQFELKVKGGRRREFRGVTFEFPTQANELVMNLFRLVDQENQPYSKPGQIVKGGQAANQHLKDIFLKMISAKRESSESEVRHEFPFPYFWVKREGGDTFGFLIDTYASCWLDSREIENVKISQLGNQMSLYLCVGPGVDNVLQQFSQISSRPQLLKRDTLKDVQSDPPASSCENWTQSLPYLPTKSDWFRSAFQNDCLVKNQLGLPYLQRTRWGDACLLDFTNTESCQWVSAMIKNSIGSEPSLRMLSRYCVPIPEDAVFQNGLGVSEMQNAYPVMALDCMLAAIEPGVDEMKEI